MNQLIVIFEFQPIDVGKQSQFWNLIVSRYASYAFLTTSSCIIWTNETPVAVRDFLKSGIGPNDKLYVGVTSAPSAWTDSMNNKVKEYIKKNLRG